jgi:hypothetical protein
MHIVATLVGYRVELTDLNTRITARREAAGAVLPDVAGAVYDMREGKGE